MRQLPKAVPELDGGLFLPRPVAELLEAVLLEDEALMRAAAPAAAASQASARTLRLLVLGELRHLLRMTGLRLRLPASAELLGLDDPQEQARARNLLKG